MRTLSSAALGSIFAQQTDKVWLILLTIDHDTLDDPIRVVNNSENITSNGHEFIAFPFQIDLPESDPDRLPEVRLTICNVDRSIVQAIRTMTSEASVTMEVVLSDSPDTVEAGPFYMTLHGAEYDSIVVTGTLGYEAVFDDEFPADDLNPSLAPGLF